MPDPDIRDGELDQFSHALRELSDSLFGYTDSNGKEHTGAYDQAQAEYNKALAEYETTKAAYDKKRATQIPDDVHKGRAAYDDTELTEAHKKMEKAKEAYDDLAAIRNETNNSERRKAGQAETYLLDFNYDNKLRAHERDRLLRQGAPHDGSGDRRQRRHVRLSRIRRAQH